VVGSPLSSRIVLVNGVVVVRFVWTKACGVPCSFLGEEISRRGSAPYHAEERFSGDLLLRQAQV